MRSHLNASQEKVNKKFGQAIKNAVDFALEVLNVSIPENVAARIRMTHFEICAFIPQTGNIFWDEWDGKWKKPGEGWKDVKVKDDVETVAFTVGKALRALAEKYPEVRDVITKGTEFPGFYMALEFNALDGNDEYMWAADQEMGMSEVILEG